MIQRVMQGQLGMFGLVMIALFCTVTAIFDFTPINILTTTINISLAVAVCIAYGREGWDAVRSPAPTRADRLALGICVAWFSNAGQRVISLGYRLSDNDPAWLQSSAVNFFFFLTCLAATLHLTAPNAAASTPRIRRQAALWISLAIGTGVAGFVLGVRWGGQ